MGRLGEQIKHIALMMSVGMALPKSFKSLPRAVTQARCYWKFILLQTKC